MASRDRLMSPRAYVEKALWLVFDSVRGVADGHAALCLLSLKALSEWRDEKLEEYRSKYEGDETKIERAMRRERFALPDDCTFQDLHANRDSNDLGEKINSVLRQIERANIRKLEGVFDRIDFNSDDLGTVEKRNARLRTLLDALNGIEIGSLLREKEAPASATSPFNELIRDIVEESGRRAETAFYTPREISTLIARLVSPTPGERIYDPCCGTGGLLLRTARRVGSNNFALFGHEPHHSTWSTCKMTLILAGMDAADIRNDDPISRPVVDKQDKLQKFDVVITNPPFALNEWGAKDFKHDRFNRFRRGIPPRSSGDYAFITHAVETMHPKTGRACVVAPLGVLFRGASEGLIRRRLIEENLLEGVIRLPANVLFGTSIPITLLLFKANKRDKSVLFIDASGDFVDEKNRSRLREQDIDKIVSTWQSRTDVAKYARLATFDEIQKNDFNLNLPLYVKAADDESYIDLAEAAARVNRLEEALKEVRSKLTLALGGLRR